MIRLFAAVPIPEDIREQLSLLCSGLPGARWSPPENFHVTLRFAGELDETQAEDFHHCLSHVEAEPFVLRIRGCGTFGTSRRPHTLWAGVELSDPLIRLQSRVETAALKAGLPPDPRNYCPHVTLARLSRETSIGRLADLIAGNNLLDLRFTASSFCLFVSHLGSGEPIYEALAVYPLGHPSAILPAATDL
jgi:2'-5' RNA ligase